MTNNEFSIKLLKKRLSILTMFKYIIDKTTKNTPIKMIFVFLSDTILSAHYYLKIVFIVQLHYNK